MKRQRIVVIDDSTETLDLVRDILEGTGYAVEVAPAADRGCTRCATPSPT